MGHDQIWVQAAREAAVLLPARGCGVLQVRGRDRLEFIHNYTTNDVKKLQPGEGCTAAVSNWRGTVSDHVRLLCRPHELLLVGTRGREQEVRAALIQFLVGVDVAIADVTGQVACVELGGPQAARILPAVRDLPLDGHRTVEFAPALADIPEAGNVLALPEDDGAPAAGPAGEDTQERVVTSAIAVRTRGVHGGGALVVVPAGAEGALRERLRRMGATAIGAEAWETVRLEEGIPEFGRDFGPDTNVWEARLDRSVSMEKGCYLGQEIVARLYNYRKVQRYLMGVRLEGAEPVATGADVAADGAIVGRVTSAAPDLQGGQRALAMIQAATAQAGRSVAVGNRGGILEDLPYWARVEA